MHINLPDKRYYKIGEVARAFNVNASLIRFWDKEFDAIKPKKNAKGNRLFTQEDVKSIQMIYHLVKEKGFTLEGARKKLRSKPVEIKNNHVIISRLEAIKATLIEFKNQL
jgi:DNA-binding transcriptional MerR regulator